MTADWFFAALRHDRAVVLGSLTLVVVLAWAWLLVGTGIDRAEMEMGGGRIMPMLLEWGLDEAGLLSDTMALASRMLAAAVLIAAGIYQWTPLKEACLRHCRSPLDFLLFHWREGGLGALTSGLGHGAYCLGCCWMLMALLFVGGIMNLAWIAAIALLVLIEKTLPGGDWMGRIIGAVLVAWGAVALAMAA